MRTTTHPRRRPQSGQDWENTLRGDPSDPQPHNARNDRQRPLSAPRFPWYL